MRVLFASDTAYTAGFGRFRDGAAPLDEIGGDWVL